MRKNIFSNRYLFFSDKQQELDLPSLQVEENTERTKKKEKPRHGGPAGTMSQVSFSYRFSIYIHYS